MTAIIGHLDENLYKVLIQDLNYSSIYSICQFSENCNYFYPIYLCDMIVDY